MTKTNPKMILNLQIEDKEFENKINLAMNEYVEKMCAKNLDAAIAKLVDNRIKYICENANSSYQRLIDGKTLKEFVNAHTEKVVSDMLDKNIKEIMAKKLASLL